MGKEEPVRRMDGDATGGGLIAGNSNLCRDFDHHDVERFGRDPFAVYKILREQCPVGWSDLYGGFYVVTSYENVFAVGEDWSTFSSAQGMTLPDINPLMRFIPIDYDPPAQQKYRHVLLPHLSSKAVGLLEVQIRDFVQSIIAELRSSDSCDLVAELASPVPMYAICLILGVPLEDQEMFKAWAHRMAHPGDNQENGVTAAMELMTYILGMVDARRSEPRDDLISHLLRVDFDGRPLTDDEIVSMGFLLLPAGFDTTESALGAIFHLLGTQPWLREQFAAVENIGDAVEEFLRLVSPVQCTSRVATQESAIGGVQIEPGQRVLIVFGAANRDEKEFPKSEDTILDRHPNRHLAFGAGVHRCVGAHLARLEIKIVLEEILRGLPPFRVPNEDAVVWHTGHIRGVARLPVEFE